MKLLLLPALVFMVATETFAGSATWKSTPFNADWNTAANWAPTTVPNGVTDTATFGASSGTTVSLSASVEVASLTFTSGAPAYSISPAPSVTLTLSGTGVTNNSGLLQSFTLFSDGNGGSIVFKNSASAGSATMYTVNPGAPVASGVGFNNTSTAGDAIFVSHGGFNPGGILFGDSASAGNAQFFFDGGPDGFNQGSTILFYSLAKGGNATFVLDGISANQQGPRVSFTMSSNAENTNVMVSGAHTPMINYFNEAEVTFGDDASAGNATLTATGGTNGGDGGLISFGARSTGGTAQVKVFGNGRLDLSGKANPVLTIGSLEGDGLANLGRTNLSIGSNSLSTLFSGIIQDGTFTTGGALTKIGTGTLTLTGSNTYTGGTTASAGALLLSNRTGSATGTGSVNVRGGILGGRGIAAGAVTIGTGSGAGGFLQPSVGVAKPTTLTIQSALTFKADGTYTYRLNTRKAKSDQVIANGVTIESGAQFNFSAVANKPLPAGTTFIAISNTSATPISGTFANLADGSSFTANGNTFQVSYERGDGNDLTLTVVP